jgi:hypothetical protein
MSFKQTGHSVLSLLVLGLVKTETLGGLGRVSSALSYIQYIFHVANLDIYMYYLIDD